MELVSPVTTHGPVHKSNLNYSYSRSHFSWLPRVVSKKLIYSLSLKVSCASKIIDPVINGFSPNELTSHFHIYDHSIFSFGIGWLFLVFSNTSHVDSLDRFIKLVVYKVKREKCILKTENNSK